MTEKDEFKEKTFKFNEYLKEADDLVESVEKSRDDRPEIADKNQKIRDEEVLKTLKKIIPGYNVENPSEISDEARNIAINAEFEKRRKLAGKDFKDNLEQILTSIPNKNLEKLATTQPILAAAEGKNQRAVVTYSEIDSIEKFENHYRAGGSSRNDSERRYEILATAEGIAKEQVKKLKEEGYNIDEETIRRLAITAIQRDEVKEEVTRSYAPIGFEKLKEEAKKQYEKAGVTVEDATKETLRKLGNSDDLNEFRTAMYLAYTAIDSKPDDLTKRLEKYGLGEKTRVAPVRSAFREAA